MSDEAQGAALETAGHHEGHLDQDPQVAYESSKLGIWLFLATEVLLFGAIFAAYTVFRLKNPVLFHESAELLSKTFGTVNTLVLILSSLTVAMGTAAIKKGEQSRMKLFYSITILLGFVFLGIKFVEYSDKFAHGIYPSENIFFSLYFSLTALHGLHIVAGMIALTVVLIMAIKGKFSAEYNTPVEIAGIYWHFVDLVWIYLFPLLYLI